MDAVYIDDCLAENSEMANYYFTAVTKLRGEDFA